MGDIQKVKLELLRSGPSHNQLLSPLTPYLALCGAEGPVTVHVPYEHAQLEARLDRLRYAVDGVEVAQAQRMAEVREMGEVIGRVLSQVPGLLAEVSRARCDGGRIVHLRLSMTANELALVPFELAIGSDGFPGSGAPLFLQTIAPITLTREVRRGRPLPVIWDRPPKILFAFAAPGDLPPVPAQDHLEALRRAIAPWMHWRADSLEQIAKVKETLTVLPNASLNAIRRACNQTSFTHVHILAHGERDPSRGRYGLLLCHPNDQRKRVLVDGEALATELTAGDSPRTIHSRPTVVSLATCDSGNPGSVVTAGASLAHALHAGGIPWVFASQFPLWMRASTLAAEILYTGLLRGDDPRWVLYNLRGRLRTSFPDTHDWASVVAYAVVPWDFENAVEAFSNRQFRQRIEVKFDEAERRMSPDGANDAVRQDLATTYQTIRADLRTWCDRLPPNTRSQERAERLGVQAASEKRIGGLQSSYDKEGATKSYGRARDLYREALSAWPTNHWVATQFLSMTAVLSDAVDLADLPAKLGSWWTAAAQIAEWELLTASGEGRAWALGTLAELALLGVAYGGASYDYAEAVETIRRRCRELNEVVGRNAFPVHSTRRQFQRYLVLWPNPLWKDLAEVGVATLPEGESWAGVGYIPNA